MRDDALPPGLPSEMHDKLSNAVKAAKDAALIAAGVAVAPAALAPDAPAPSPAAAAAAAAVALASGSVVAAAKPSKWDALPTKISERAMTDDDERVIVQVPVGSAQRDLIDRLARYISKDGQVKKQSCFNCLFHFSLSLSLCANV